MKLQLLLVFSILFGMQAFSQRSYMVKDLNPGSSDAFDQIKTGLLTELNDKAIFIAYAKGGNRLLCVTDGTDLGTASLLPPITSNDIFEGYTVSNGLLWFILNKDGVAQMYSSDGTWSGTILRHEVMDTDAYFSKLIAFKDGVVFHANGSGLDNMIVRYNEMNGAQNIGSINPFGGLLDMCMVGDEVWGIGAVTPVADRYVFRSTGLVGIPNAFFLINIGNDELNTNINMTAVGDKAFFFFQKNGEDAAVWVTDGTEMGTMPLVAMERPSVFGGPHIFSNLDRIAYNGNFYFQGECPTCTDGLELWKSDGTSIGTIQLANLDNGSGASQPQRMTAWNNLLYLTAKNSSGNTMLWKTDGTASGTSRVLSQFEWNQYHGSGFTIYNDSLAFGGITDDYRGEAFLSDGTVIGTHEITAESPLDDDSFYPDNFLQAGEKLYFTAIKPSKGRELWCYDSSLPKLVDAKSLPWNLDVKVYPNPSSSTLHIDLDKNYKELSVSILSLDGRVLKQEHSVQVNKTSTIDLGALPSGKYQLLLSDNEEFLGVQQFVKE